MIYVMTSRDQPERVKIGLTTVVAEKRRRGLFTGHGSPLTVAHLIQGDKTVETEIHERFAASRVPDGGEWFFRTQEINAWLDTLDPHVESLPRETALQWLERCRSPRAKQAIESWNALVAHGKGVGSCSHTLWDMLAGAKGIVEPLFGRTLVRLKGRLFEFPIFQEACVRQGTLPPAGAVAAKTRPKSHRMPQPKRWGTKLRASQ